MPSKNKLRVGSEISIASLNQISFLIIFISLDKLTWLQASNTQKFWQIMYIKVSLLK